LNLRGRACLFVCLFVCDGRARRRRLAALFTRFDSSGFLEYPVNP
jgi:hypothetical protein